MGIGQAILLIWILGIIGRMLAHHKYASFVSKVIGGGFIIVQVIFFIMLIIDTWYVHI